MNVRVVLCAGLAAVLPACVTEEIKQPPRDWEFMGEEPSVAIGRPPAGQPPVDDELLSRLTPATAADIDPDFLSDDPPSPFHRLGHNVIRGMDGTWTKMYTLRAGSGQAIVELLRAYVPGFPTEPNVASPPDVPRTESVRWSLQAGFYKDEFPVSFGTRSAINQGGPGVTPAIADVLHVTAPPEVLLFIDELLAKMLGDLPQIELEIRVVELNLDDTIDYDVSTFISNLTNPSEPFDPESNPIDGRFGKGIPILANGDPTGAGSAFNSYASQPDISVDDFLLTLQGIHDNLVIDTLLSILQTISSFELVSSPTVTVLNGHRARLTTGDKIPVFAASGSVLNPNVTTSFVQTGVSSPG